MRKQKKSLVPILRVKKGADLKTIYRKAREAFTAADLQRYTEVDEETVPARQVLNEMERFQCAFEEKRKGKAKGSKKHVGRR
jgi:hypothetical protein